MFKLGYSIFKKYDFVNLFLALSMTFLGMITFYHSFGDNQHLFFKQTISLAIALFLYFIFSNIDIRFYKNQKFINFIYFATLFLLFSLYIFGSVLSGAKSWINLGFFAFQPTDFAKLVLVLVLAKYFAKKHLEINKLRHLFFSGFYAFWIFLLILIQPDLGSALTILGIWFFMILIFGVSKKYVISFLLLGSVLAVLMYSFGLKPYQQERVKVFLGIKNDPLGSGYNINQANIALGSGQIFGKGIGEGTQNHLGYLPESETDFIISSFGEEWGFLGIILYLIIYLIFSLRILWIAYTARSNFESMLVIGILVYYTIHFIFHIGINLDIFPVTGVTLAFMSYGGSHLLVEFIGLGIINRVRNNSLLYNRNEITNREIEINL